MSTSITTPLGTAGSASTTSTISTTPVTMAITGGTSAEILAILQAALNVAAVIPASAPYAAAAAIVMQIIAAAVNRIQSQTGQPINLSLIPTEAPLP